MTGDPNIDGLLDKLARTAHNPRAPKFHRTVAAVACRAVRQQRPAFVAGEISSALEPTEPKHLYAETERHRFIADRGGDTITIIPREPEQNAEPQSPSWKRCIALACLLAPLWAGAGATIAVLFVL
jgi:hypothetical protein